MSGRCGVLCCVVTGVGGVVVMVGFNRPTKGYEVPVVQGGDDDYEMQAVPQPQASRTKNGTKTKTKSNAKDKKNGRADFSDYVNVAKVVRDSASAHSVAADNDYINLPNIQGCDGEDDYEIPPDHDYINLPNMQGCDGEDDYEMPTVQQTRSGASASAHSAAAGNDYVNVHSPASAVVPGVPTSTKTRSDTGKGKDRQAGRNGQSTIMTRPSAKGAKGKVAALLNRFSNPEPSEHTGRRQGSIKLRGFDTSDTNL